MNNIFTRALTLTSRNKEHCYPLSCLVVLNENKQTVIDSFCSIECGSVAVAHRGFDHTFDTKIKDRVFSGNKVYSTLSLPSQRTFIRVNNTNKPAGGIRSFAYTPPTPLRSQSCPAAYIFAFARSTIF